MATITHGGTLTDGSKSDFYGIIDAATISGIINADIGAGAAIVDTKLAQITTANKVAAGAITDAALNVAAVTCDSVAVAANGGILLTEGTLPVTGAGVGALYTKDSGGQPELFYGEESAGDEVQITNGGSVGSGKILQVVNTFTQAKIADTTNIPLDDSIPQITEGTLCLTRTITPNFTTSYLLIQIKLQAANGTASSEMGGALFNTVVHATNAIACGMEAATTNRCGCIGFDYYYTPNSVAEQTFTVRFGGHTNGYLNAKGDGTSRYGDKLVSSITITEIAA